MATITVSPVHFEDYSGILFERLVFAYHLRAGQAIYDLSRQIYTSNVQLAEISTGRADDATPACLTYDELCNCIYVGMFQSMRGICVIEPESGQLIQEIRFYSSDNNNFSHGRPSFASAQWRFAAIGQSEQS